MTFVGRVGLKVDIATRVVAKDEDIYIVLPDAGYALCDEFDRTGRVSLDFLGLALDISRELLEATRLREMIARVTDPRLALGQPAVR